MHQPTSNCDCCTEHRRVCLSVRLFGEPRKKRFKRSRCRLAGHSRVPRNRVLAAGKCGRILANTVEGARSRTGAEGVDDGLSCVDERFEVGNEEHSSRSASCHGGRVRTADGAQFLDGPSVPAHVATHADHHQFHAGRPAPLRLQPRTHHVVRPATAIQHATGNGWIARSTK